MSCSRSLPACARARSCLAFTTLAALLASQGLVAAPSTTLESARPKPLNNLETARPLPPGPPRWAEDYRFLDDPQKRTDPFDGLRYQRLSDSAWLQTGGEARYRFDTIRNPVFGRRGVDTDHYIQQRLQLHADLHLFDDALRAFVQLENTRAWNKALYGPYDQSRTELHQAFIDLNTPLAGGKLMTRIGRQELGYGNQAFVTYRDIRDSPFVSPSISFPLSFPSQQSRHIRLLPFPSQAVPIPHTQLTLPPQPLQLHNHLLDLLNTLPHNPVPPPPLPHLPKLLHPR